MYIYQKSINPAWIQCFGQGGRTLTPIWSWSLPEDPILKHPPHFSSIIISKQFRFLIWNIFLFWCHGCLWRVGEKRVGENPERNPLFLQNTAEPVQMTMVHVCQQFTVAPGLGLRPHSRGGCIIVTGFRSRAVKQFHAVNRKCNRLRVSILVSRQFTRHTKDNALQEQFLPMRTLSPLTQAECLYNILLCASCTKKGFKSVEGNRTQDYGHQPNSELVFF